MGAADADADADADAERGTLKEGEQCDSSADGKGCIADHQCAKAGGDAVDELKKLMGDKWKDQEACVKAADCGTEKEFPGSELKIEVICAAKALAATATAVLSAALLQ